ncbi:hypothetical protein PCASD_20757, partial [Puccinia coronata f. sp. avenae]
VRCRRPLKEINPGLHVDHVPIPSDKQTGEMSGIREGAVGQPEEAKSARRSSCELERSTEGREESSQEESASDVTTPATSQEDAMACMICLDEISDLRPSCMKTASTCGHPIHCGCYINAIQNDKRWIYQCPLCKGEVVLAPQEAFWENLDNYSRNFLFAFLPISLLLWIMIRMAWDSKERARK